MHQAALPMYRDTYEFRGFLGINHKTLWNESFLISSIQQLTYYPATSTYEENLWLSLWAYHITLLAVLNSSIGDLVPCLVGWAPLTIRVFTTLQGNPRDLWPLRHLIRVMRGHDLTKKIQWQWQIQRQRQLQRQWHRQSQRLVTFETLITILTIENLIL